MTTISFLNFKGGVGKTTSALNLAAAFAIMGKQVLLIDLDPQRNLSSVMGYRPEDGESIYDALLTKGSVLPIYDHDRIPNFRFVPSDIRLKDIEIDLYKRINKEKVLENLIKPWMDKFDYIFIDCPPSQGILQINAMSASDYLIIPIDCKVFSLHGMGDITMAFDEIKADVNEKLQIMGYLLTLYEGNTRLSQSIEASMRDRYKELVFKTRIRKNTRLGETPAKNLNIYEYDVDSIGAEDYMALAEEILQQKRPDNWKTIIPIPTTES